MGDFDRNSRTYLFPGAITILDFINEMYSGPCVKCQEAGYQELVLQINGILKRYVKDYHNSKFYELKETCVSYLLALTEDGTNESEVCQFVL